MNINNLNDKGKKEFVNRKKTNFIENKRSAGKSRNFRPKLVPKLKMEISSLISLEIVRKGRPFSDGVFIKQLFQKNLAKA